MLGSWRGLNVNAIRPPKNRHLRMVVPYIPPPPPLPGARSRRLAKRFIWATYGAALSVGWTMSAITLSFTAGITATALCAFAEFTNRLRQDADNRSLEP